MSYANIYKNILFPFYETRLRNRKTLVYLKELEKNQWLSEEKLKDIQWAKLKNLLSHAYAHVPYYRKKFDKLGMTPDDIETPADFVKLPILTREDIRNNQETLIADNYRKRKLLDKTTSGSTGVPLKYKYDRVTYEWHMAAAARSDRWAGWDYGKKELYIWGRPPYKVSRFQKTKQHIHHRILQRKIINTFSISIGNIAKKIEEINRFKPRVIIGYASSLYTLARHINQSGVACHKPAGIISSAEKLFPYQREALEKAFQAEVFDRYGCQEVMLIANECEKHAGMHMNIDNLYIETLKDNQTAAPQELGEVCITDLNNFAMPFIRYKNGDIAVMSDRQCACGRGLPLLEKIEGRTIDIITTPDGKMISGEVFLYIIDRFLWVKKYQVVQEKLDSLNIFLVRDFHHHNDITHDLSLIKREMTEVFGSTMKIHIEFLDDINLTASGKSRIVTSKVAAGTNNG